MGVNPIGRFIHGRIDIASVHGVLPIVFRPLACHGDRYLLLLPRERAQPKIDRTTSSDFAGVLDYICFYRVGICTYGYTFEPISQPVAEFGVFGAASKFRPKPDVCLRRLGWLAMRKPRGHPY